MKGTKKYWKAQKSGSKLCNDTKHWFQNMQLLTLVSKQDEISEGPKFGVKTWNKVFGAFTSLLVEFLQPTPNIKRSSNERLEN